MVKNLLVAIALMISIRSACPDEPPNVCVPHSCSTFELKSGGSIFIGHNLDDYFDVPGLVVVNKRGVRKQSFNWEDDLLPFFRKRNPRRAAWSSQYGSITYNTLGRELPDGGMNEAGLYVGEMTLMSTMWPHNANPSLYHHLWIQYLLDSFYSVDEVVNSLELVSVSGHNRWHFFVEDRSGDAAVIEFLDGKALVYQKTDLPYKILCNSSYSLELSKIKSFKGFGGGEDIQMYNRNVDNRFVWAASMLQGYAANPTDPVPYAFQMLTTIDLGGNRWKIVCDLTQGKMYFCAEHALRIRSIACKDFSFDNGPSLCLDIHKDLEGEVAGQFQPLTDKINRDYIRKAVKLWAWHFDRDVAGIYTRFYPRLFGDRLFAYTKAFTSLSVK